MENPRGGCGRWSRTLVWHREACVCDEIRVRRMWAIIGEGGEYVNATPLPDVIRNCKAIVSVHCAKRIYCWDNRYREVLLTTNYGFELTIICMCACECVLRNCWGICWLVYKIMDGIGECGNVARDNTPDYLSPPRNSMRNGSNVAYTASADTGGI